MHIMATAFIHHSEVATAFQVSPQTAINWFKRGKLKGFRQGRAWYMKRDDFEAIGQEETAQPVTNQQSHKYAMEALRRDHGF